MLSFIQKCSCTAPPYPSWLRRSAEARVSPCKFCEGQICTGRVNFFKSEWDYFGFPLSVFSTNALHSSSYLLCSHRMDKRANFENLQMKNTFRLTEALKSIVSSYFHH